MTKKKVVKKVSLSKKKREKNVKKVSLKSSKKVVKKGLERVGTGVRNLDELMGKGFAKNSTNLIVGPSGSGKSIFGVEFLIEGIKKGEACLYITFEEEKKAFYKNLYEIGYDLEKLEREGKFLFLEYSPQKVKTMLEEGGGAIETLVLTKKVTRLVFDSASSFMLLFDNELDKKDAVLALFSLVKGWDCTTLLVIEEDPKERSSSRIIDLESDGILLLYFNRKGKQRKRSIEILKMRGTNHSLKLHTYTIGKNGISVSP